MNMNDFPRHPLIKLIAAPLRTFLLSLVFLAILLGAAEGLARLPSVQSHLLPQSVGKHENLGLKLQQLDAIVEEEGVIDCIFLGDSAVYEDINPEAFAAAALALVLLSIFLILQAEQVGTEFIYQGF